MKAGGRKEHTRLQKPRMPCRAGVRAWIEVVEGLSIEEKGILGKAQKIKQNSEDP